MDMEAAERLQRARLARFSSDKKTHSANGGWVAASLLKSYSWDSPYCPLMDFSIPLPSAHSVKENMEEDGERVNKLFEKAPEVGIQVQWRSISAQELSMLILSGQYLVIALVDKRKLCYPWLEELCLSDCCGMITGYTGHYVVICGYDMDSDEFEIRDPASSSEHGRISSQALDEARKSFDIP